MDKPLALIIEDDPQLGNIYSLTLRPDFDIELCSDGLAAASRLEQISPAIIILDLHLPGASGLELLKRIRANPNLTGIKIILVTFDRTLAATLVNQVDLVLPKPVSPSQLSELALRLYTGK